ncbi:hypothetical protein N7470_009201 [Penicillium chermesinum]|nr:hypothetical protein N7470_009201 [Penicillium chermesinum]
MLFRSALLLFVVQNAIAERHDADLMSFVTLPEVRALKWEVTHYDRERQAPGYWFVAPYGQITPENPTQKYQQYQVGPYIYDNDGMLIWAGAPLYDNRNVFDFKPNYNADGEPYLSMIVNWDIENHNSDKGRGVTINKHYEVQGETKPDEAVHDFNMHEYNILDGGKTALTCVYRSEKVNLADFGRPTEESWVQTGGFAEYDLETNEMLVQWNSADHIALHESNMFHSYDSAAADEPGWDYVHANAVDKNAAGDYILSLRFTDTIYGISGVDGSIMWRLGGLESDFTQDFTFSRQHDAKFVSSEGTKHVIFLLNNAADERGNQESMSSVLYIELDTETMTAVLQKRINRPDSGFSLLRGSAQTLPNGNTFAGWSQYGYQTSVYGTSNTDITTIIHVSWNGATGVAGWNFYAQAYDRGDPVLVGHANKTDFETMYIVDGYMDWITAEAVDINGNEMMKSGIVRSAVPSNWKAVGFQGASNPSPDDPSLMSSIHENPDSGSVPDGESDVVDGSKTVGSAVSDSSYADAKEVAKSVYKAYDVIRGVGGLLLLLLLASSVGGAGFAIYRYVKGRKNRAYQHVATDEDIPTEEIHLRSQAPQ